MIRKVTLVALPVLLVVAGLVVVLRGGDDGGPGPDEARVTVIDGVVVVNPDARSAEDVTDRAVVAFGDVVAVRSGSAVLELADGSTYELRHHGGTGSSVVVGAAPLLTAGDVLVSDGFPAEVKVAGASLRAQGPLRVDAEESVAASYAGRARVSGAGDVDELQGLRRLVLVPGAEPEPVRFDGTDPWDRRHLGEAIAFGERLEALARGYTSDVAPGAGRSVDFFRSVLPALGSEREFNADLLDPARPAGETLIGAAIVVQGRQGTFRSRWDEVFAFRAAGAAWGLVALDQRVSSAPVLETIELAIGTPASVTDEASGPGTTTTTAGTPGPPGPTTTTTGTSTTTTPPAPPPPGGLLDPVTDPASELVGGLLDLLLGSR